VSNGNHLNVNICYASDIVATLTISPIWWFDLSDHLVTTYYNFILQILGIEILNVLHRLLLTRDSHLSQSLVLSVVKNVLKAAEEKLYDGRGISCSIGPIVLPFK